MLLRLSNFIGAAYIPFTILNTTFAFAAPITFQPTLTCDRGPEAARRFACGDLHRPMTDRYAHLAGLAPESLQWHPLPGFAGLHVHVLSDDLDEEARTGSRTRIVRFDPGAKTDVVLSHDYWEEVLCLSGDLHETSVPPLTGRNFVRRPPHTPHGPFHSGNGCLLVEFQYFAARR
jgi:hypothetical protein